MRVAATGSVEAVHDLAELISLCAQARADGRAGEAEAWAATAALLGRGALAQARAELRERGDATALAELARAAAGAGSGRARLPLRTTFAWGKVEVTMLASLWFVADAAEEGRKVVLSMLVVGLIFVARDRDRRADALPRGQAQGPHAQPHAVGPVIGFSRSPGLRVARPSTSGSFATQREFRIARRYVRERTRLRNCTVRGGIRS